MRAMEVGGIAACGGWIACLGAGVEPVRAAFTGLLTGAVIGLCAVIVTRVSESRLHRRVRRGG